MLYVFLVHHHAYLTFYPLISVKSLKEDEWILDPAVIADTYGPEVLVCLVVEIPKD